MTTAGSTRPLRVLAHVHGFPPAHSAGAEQMLAAMLRHLISQGHECKVIVPNSGKYLLSGIEVSRPTEAWRTYRWADIVITHLDLTTHIIKLCAGAGRPLVHLIHNPDQLSYHSVTPESCQLAVFNSRHLAETYSWQGPQVICRPPVDIADYQVRQAGLEPLDPHTTLINLMPAKGGDIFWALARRLPNKQFLGVKGAYGQQMIPNPGLPNVKVNDTVADIRPIYEQTRILLVPSLHESWGRVGIEACASGIPVIASPTPGLRESLGDAGIFVDTRNVRDWANAITSLDNQFRYRAASLRAYAHAMRLNPAADLAAFETSIRETIDRYAEENAGAYDNQPTRVRG